MTQEYGFRALLDRYLKPYGEPPNADVAAALERVWRRMQPDMRRAPARLSVRSMPARRPVRLVAAVAAAAIVIVVVSSSPWPGTDALGRVEAADGSLYSLAGDTPRSLRQGDSIGLDEVLRSNGGAGAMLALADGSRVEMRSASELLLERAIDGLKIRLVRGSVIVNASKQRDGHLYVQTKDMTVSVVGTVFVVNAADDGSRVAVIEGEVRVHEGNTATTLRPGEQVSTNPAVVTRSVKEEIAWSREADALGAILATFTRGMELSAGPRTPLADGFVPITGQAQPAAPRPQFEEASIRTCDPDNIPEPPTGSRGGGPNSFQVTPGRTHALCMTLASIIRLAYGYYPVVTNPGGRGRGPAMNSVYALGVEDGVRVRGGADWVRSERYTIDAVAEGDAETATMAGPMLKDLLERRFKLKVHVETEQIPAWVLTVAPGGLKMKEGTCTQAAAGSAPGGDLVSRNLEAARRGETTSFPCGSGATTNGTNMILVGAGWGIPTLASVVGAPVIDRTGIPETVRFNYVLEFAPDERAAGVFGKHAVEQFAASALRAGRRLPDVPQAPDLFTALEQQLGLRLEPERAPREFIVIDQVERPAAN
jgi:uncharacterized protein (TIGR03435 family)